MAPTKINRPHATAMTLKPRFSAPIVRPLFRDGEMLRFGVTPLAPPKESLQPSRRARPPTARELESRRGFRPARRGLILGRPTWVRGRHDTGASCPSCNLAREAVTLSLATRTGGRRCADPVGETAPFPFPSWLASAAFAPATQGSRHHEPTQAFHCPRQTHAQAVPTAPRAATGPDRPQPPRGRH